MGCELTFEHQETKENIFQKAKNAIESQGGQVSGNEESGSFSISKMGFTVAGSYKINEKDVLLKVDKKPMFVSCNQIKEMVAQSFNSGSKGIA